MQQTRLESIIEQLFNIGSGLLISALIVQPIIFPIFNIHTTIHENIIIAIMFTTVSMMRGYIWRRAFNHIKFQKFIQKFTRR